MAGTIVNRTGGVKTEDGRTLYGFDAELYRKMKAKEDPEMERKVGEWIEDLLGEQIADTSDLYRSLKDGIVLTKIANKIKPGVIPKINRPKKAGQPLHVLMERENINLYLEACWKIGIPSTEIFVTSDLHGRRGMSQVIGNLIAVSQIAPNFGITSPKPLGPSAPPPKASVQFKWEVKEHSTLHVDEIPQAPEEVIKQLQNDLDDSKLKIEQLEHSNMSLKEDLKKAREELRAEKKNQTESETTHTETKTGSPVPNLRVLSPSPKMRKHKEKKKVKNTPRNDKPETSEVDRLKATLEAVQLELQNEKLRYKEAVDQINDLSRLLKLREAEAEKARENVIEKKPFSVAQFESRVKNIQRRKSERALKRTASQADFDRRVDMYDRLHEVVDALMSEKTQTPRITNDLLDVFRNDAGRRIFAHLLRESIVEAGGKPVCVSSSSFALLSSLILSALNAMNFSNGADYISGKYILQACYYIYTKVRTGKVYLQERIYEHHIWRNLSFWEEYFWDKSAAKFPDDAADPAKQRAYLSKQVEKCAKGMYGWGKLPTSGIIQFIHNVAQSLVFDELTVSHLDRKLSEFVEKRNKAGISKHKRDPANLPTLPKSRDDFVKQLRKESHRRSRSVSSNPMNLNESRGSMDSTLHQRSVSGSKGLTLTSPSSFGKYDGQTSPRSRALSDEVSDLKLTGKPRSPRDRDSDSDESPTLYFTEDDSVADYSDAESSSSGEFEKIARKVNAKTNEFDASAYLKLTEEHKRLQSEMRQRDTKIKALEKGREDVDLLKKKIKELQKELAAEQNTLAVPTQTDIDQLDALKAELEREKQARRDLETGLSHFNQQQSGAGSDHKGAAISSLLDIIDLIKKDARRDRAEQEALIDAVFGNASTSNNH